MSEIERVSLAFERGKAAALAGLDPWKASPYPTAHFLWPWFYDGFKAVARRLDHDRIFLLRDSARGVE
jgi:hypothetical protein